MELNTITMDRDEAAEKAADYRTLKAPDEEERGLAAAFTALAAGKQIIDLHAVIRDGGEFDDGAPRLAVMDVDARWCYVQRTRGGAVTFSRHPRLDGRMSRGVFRFPRALRERQDISYDLSNSWTFSLRSQVPLVPPVHWARGWKSMLVLWEVEEWAKAPRPPGDPALLRHLTGPLYTVEAVWELTPLEQAVLGRRDG